MITVRNATVEDVPFIKEMMWEATLASPVMLRGYGKESRWQEQERHWAAWDQSRKPVFLAEDSEGRKLGVVSLTPYEMYRQPKGWELGIGVVAWARRQGVGRLLMQRAIDYSQETNTPYAILFVDPVNRSAQRLYRKLGFKIWSKRHGVIEMRLSFGPEPTVDSAPVADRRYFLQYWTNAEYYSGRGRLHHCSPYYVEHKWFRRAGLKAKDFVYMVTVIKGGLHLIVKYEVDQLMTYEEAKIQFPKSDDLDPTTGHLLAGRSTLYSFEPPIDLEVTQALRLLDKGEPKPLPLNRVGQLDGHSLRGVREITPESARLLDGFVEIFRRPILD